MEEEIFDYPTVKKVIFQIRYSNLFYMEKKISDIQLKIMDKFPDSQLLIRRHIVFANVGSMPALSDIQNDTEEEEIAQKIWKFESNKDYQLNIMSDSLDIVSQHHKTYSKSYNEDENFRNIIEFVLSNFFEVIPIRNIKRIGLRYIDECPIPKKDNKTFQKYYNSVFPLTRFDLSKSEEMDFKVVINKGAEKLRYIESLSKNNDNYNLILDFDGYSENIISTECMEKTDILHKIISDEYLHTIKEPLKDFMRTGDYNNGSS